MSSRIAPSAASICWGVADPGCEFFEQNGAAGIVDEIADVLPQDQVEGIGETLRGRIAESQFGDDAVQVRVGVRHGQVLARCASTV
jgi:hypothetical protein